MIKVIVFYIFLFNVSIIVIFLNFGANKNKTEYERYLEDEEQMKYLEKEK